MPQNCSVPNCKTAPGDRKRFFKFPLHDPERLDLWLRNMGRNNWTPSQHQYICHQHFAPSNFKVRRGVRYLKNTAVPTLFQKEKMVGDNERRLKWRQTSINQSMKRLDLATDAVGAQIGSSPQLELCGLGQICDLGHQDHSLQDMNPPILKDQQITLHTIDDFGITGDSAEMVLISEDQNVHGLTTSGPTNVQGVDLENLTCTVLDLSNVYEIRQTPDIAYFEVIPSLFLSQTSQLTFVPETVLSSALSPQPITSTLPIVSKHVQSSSVDKSPDTEEEEEDDLRLDSSSFEHQRQVEHCYHKNSMSKEQLEAMVVDLQKKVKILQQRHNRHLDKVQELEKTVAQLRQSNLLYEERLQLLERATFQANISDHGEIVTIIYEENNPEYFCTNIS